MSKKIDFKSIYRDFVSRLRQTEEDIRMAMSKSVGGNFDYMGSLQKQFLVKTGLKESDYIIDIGCGSGRLASQLISYITTGKYLGIDIVQDLLDYARNIATKENFEFTLNDGYSIPEKDNQADFIVLFSVFTHLPQEGIYLYLRDITRVLKPEGKIVFSFFEFGPAHLWHIFEEEVCNMNVPHIYSSFISRDGINAWTEHLGLRVQEYFDADKKLVKNMIPAKLDDGTISDVGILGQSVCILTK